MVTEIEREPGAGLTFEKIWALFEETDRRMKETELLIKETGLQMKETDRKISKLGGQLDELIEHLMAPNILEKFNKLGYVFGKAGPNVRFVNLDGSFAAEVDILLENGNTVLAMDVKAKPVIDDVREHVRRMEKLRCYADKRRDQRKLMGAVAGAIISEGVKRFALKNGFYVLEQAGDTVKIDVPENFTPKVW